MFSETVPEPGATRLTTAVGLSDKCYVNDYGALLSV